MDKAQRIEKIARIEEDRILLAKVYDKIMVGVCRQIPASTMFLTPREQQLVKTLFRDVDVVFFGGVSGAERGICLYLPDYLSIDDLEGADCPVCAVRASFYAADDLCHRDFLGGLMACGIKRETVGDIFVSPGSCDFLVTREILPYLLQNFQSAGRTKLQLEQIALSDISVPEAKTEEIRTTVPSLRLDCIVGAGFGLARAKAADCIESGRVSLNDIPVLKPDKPAAEGDKISLRGMGKIQLKSIDGKTRKDRLGITVCRFR